MGAFRNHIPALFTPLTVPFSPRFAVPGVGRDGEFSFDPMDGSLVSCNNGTSGIDNNISY